MPPLKFKEKVNRSRLSDKPWPLKHEPVNLDDVSIHSSKIKEILASLDCNSSTKLLVLSGPPGAAKSTCIKLIAKSKGLNLVEYVDPESSIGETSVSHNFEEFLLGASMYDPQTTLILIEDLPNLFHDDTRILFEDCLEHWVQESQHINMPVIVLCFTEIEVNAKYGEALVVPRALSNLIELKPYVDWIKVNPINAQLLKKRINAVAKAESVKVPANHLKIMAACGDIRSALNSLELYSRNVFQNQNVTDLWLRGDSVQLFHAVGKLVHGSSDPSSVPHHVAKFHDTIDTFNLTLLENYTIGKRMQLSASAAANASDWLSLGDISSGELGVLAALGVGHAINNSEPDTNQHRAFVGLKFTKHPLWMKEYYQHKSSVRTQIKNDLNTCRMSERDKVLDERAFSAYLNIKNKILPDSDSDSDLDDSLL